MTLASFSATTVTVRDGLLAKMVDAFARQATGKVTEVRVLPIMVNAATTMLTVDTRIPSVDVVEPASAKRITISSTTPVTLTPEVTPDLASLDQIDSLVCFRTWWCVWLSGSLYDHQERCLHFWYLPMSLDSSWAWWILLEKFNLPH